MRPLSPAAPPDPSIPCLLLRLPIGVLFLFAGINKFVGGYGNFTSWMIGEFTEKTWLPAFMLYPFTYTLPFVEVVLGAALIVGLLTRPALIVSGLLLVSLLFGKVLLKDYATVSQIATYILLVAGAYWSSGSNRYSIDGVLLPGTKGPAEA